MNGHKSFHACNNVNHIGETNTWFTPKYIIDSLGDFDLDPCTESYRPFNIAKKSFCFDRGDCGLKNNWNGRVWLNPPYGKEIKFWLDKLYQHGNGLALVFSRTETKWSQEHLKKCDAVLFIEKRIKFINKNGNIKNNAANGNMLLAYGKNNIEFLKNINGVLFVNKKDEWA